MTEPTKSPVDPAVRIRVRLQLFGAFRDAARGGELTVEVPAGTTVRSLRVHVKAALEALSPARRHDLVDLSALASDAAILPDGHPLRADVALSLLPPVCGG